MLDHICSTRLMIGLLLIIRGAVYILGHLLPAAYEHLANPFHTNLYVYGLIIMLIGLWLLITVRYSHMMLGRIAAAFAAACSLFIAGGDFANRYYPQIPEWVVVALFSIWEASINSAADTKKSGR